MARSIRIETSPPPPPPIVEIQLTLSLEEASALARVLDSVGGDPSTTRRGLCDRINAALIKAGAEPGPNDIDKSVPRRGDIYFAESK
jgi:hypothetical protein